MRERRLAVAVVAAAADFDNAVVVGVVVSVADIRLVVVVVAAIVSKQWK